MMNTDNIDLLGVHVSPIRTDQLHMYIARSIRSRAKTVVLHVNVHCLNLAYNQIWMRRFLNSADIVFCDGAGVILGARILGHNIPERITYADWMWHLAALAEKEDFSLFFLGAKPGIADKAAARLSEKHPGLRIIGTHHGYFNKTAGNPENEMVIRKINAASPNILIVGFGMPLQEKWLMENRDRINFNVALTGGAVFDYISGELRRAPRWMTDNGLEWLGRLLIEPRRLWRRYVVGNPLFFWRVLKQRFGVLHLEEP